MNIPPVRLLFVLLLLFVGTDWQRDALASLWPGVKKCASPACCLVGGKNYPQCLAARTIHDNSSIEEYGRTRWRQQRNNSDSIIPNLVVQVGHSADVLAVAFSPDGRLVASGCLDGAVKLWDVQTRRELRTLAGAHGPVQRIAFSFDGRIVAAAGIDATVAVWDVYTGILLHTLFGKVRPLDDINPLDRSAEVLAFSPVDNVVAAASADNTIHLWDARTGAAINSLPTHESPIRCLAFDHTGEYLASIDDDGELVVWSTRTGKSVRRLQQHDYWTIAFARDATHLIGCDAYRYDEIDIRNGRTRHTIKLLREVPYDEEERTSLAISARGKYVAVAWPLEGVELSGKRQYAIGIWDVQAETLIASYSSWDALRSLAFRPGMPVVAAGRADGSIMLCNFAEQTPPKLLRGWTGLGVYDVSPDGRTVLSTSKGRIAAWDLTTGVQKVARDVLSPAGQLCFSRDGRYVAVGAGNGEIRTWDSKDGKLVSQIQTGGNASWIAMSPTSHSLISDRGSGGIGIWDYVSGLLLPSSRGDRLRFDRSHHLAVAFSPDGTQLAAGDDSGRVNIWSASDGKPIRSFTDLHDPVRSLAYSPDGHLLAGQSGPGAICVWNVESGNMGYSFPSNGAFSASIAFSPDSKSLVTGMRDGKIVKWDLSTGHQLPEMEQHKGPILSVCFSPNGRLLACGSRDGSIWISDASSGHVVRRLDCSSPVVCVGFSPDGDRLGCSSSGGMVYLWNVQTGQQIQMLTTSPALNIYNIAYGTDGETVACRTFSGEFHLFRAEGLSQLSVGYCSTFAFRPDGKAIALGGETGGIGVYRVPEFDCIGDWQAHNIGLMSLAYSDDGKIIATSDGRTARVWNVATQQQVFSLDGDVSGIASLAFCPSHCALVGGTNDGKLVIWDSTNGKRRGSVQVGTSVITDLTVRRNGLVLAFGMIGNKAYVVDIERQAVIGTTLNTAKLVTGTAFEERDDLVISDGLDGCLQIQPVSAASDDPLCSLYSLDNGTWVVTDQVGHFDTNNLGEIMGLHWVMPDDPLRPLPPELYVRDYYEPGLLTRLLSKDPKAKPPLVRPLADLNRAQPSVKIARVKLESHSKDTVAITIETQGGEFRFQRDGKEVIHRTGVYDLRLFRDGELVGQAPGDVKAFETEPRPGDLSDASLKTWRNANELKLESLPTLTGKRTYSFHHIKLPHAVGQKAVEFSAYAFNEDRVKSETDRKIYDLPASIQPRRGRVYLICIGVGGNQDRDLSLPLPAGDAREMLKQLSKKLAGADRPYEEAIPIPLISDPDKPVSRSEGLPTRENLHTVLDLLAGHSVSPDRLDAIPPALRDRLRPSTPDDLVLIFFSGHGEKDALGTLYLFPYDTGQTSGTEIGPELLSHCISSDQLAFWLRDVDAGQMAMILDACHSAAATGALFKPAPLGDRGLGQLSYDKQMRILAATQADNVAKGPAVLGSGLLTYALVKEGLEQGKALKAGMFDLKDWLEYAVQRVSALYKEHYSDQAVQQPMLLDLVRRSPDVVLGAQ